MKYCTNTPLFVVMRFISTLLWLVILFLPIVVLSQAPSSVSQEQMKKLDFLIGEWKGKGWLFPYGSGRIELSQSTKVRRGKDGSTLRIDDKQTHSNLLPPGMSSNDPMTLSAPASIYFDEGATFYYWRWETPEGHKQPFEARLIDPRTLQIKMDYKFPTRSLSVVTIKVTEDGEWHETEELWMGNKDGWLKVRETVLKKVK